MMPRVRVHHLSQEEIDALRGIILSRSTGGKLHFASAIEELPGHPACSPETAQWIRDRIAWYHARGKRVEWPQSVRRAARITPALAAKFRGSKAAAAEAPKVARGGYWVDAQGNTRELEPYVLYESDDVSLNEPFRWKDPDTGLWMAGRQTLVSADIGSGAFLSANLIGRPRDAYRQEDIADHFLDTCEQYGMPHAWRLEHGAWAATFVSGIEVEGMTHRWGGLDALFQVVHTTGPQSKGFIESRFHFLQTLLGHTEGGITIGRQAGEFEVAAQLMRRIGYDRRRAEENRVSDQAAVQRLWKIESCADAVRAAMERCNARPMKRSWSPSRMVPAEVLQAAGKGREIPETERWRFHPCKRTATVRRGQIEVKLPQYSMPFRFSVNGVGDLYLEDGYKVLIAFHPGRPELGCALGNREKGVRNYQSWSLGEIIHHALPYEPMLPQIDLSTPSGTAGNGMARAHATGIRTEFRAVRKQMDDYRRSRMERLAHESRSAPAASGRRSEGRDSKGNRVEHSGTVARIPDLSDLREEASDDKSSAPADELESFRRSSLFTDEERDRVRYG